jgi:hypothetical protein
MQEKETSIRTIVLSHGKLSEEGKLELQLESPITKTVIKVQSEQELGIVFLENPDHKEVYYSSDKKISS